MSEMASISPSSPMYEQLAEYRARKAQERSNVVKNSSRRTYSHLIRSQKFNSEDEGAPSYQYGSGFVDPSSVTLGRRDRLICTLDGNRITRPLVRYPWISTGIVWFLLWALAIWAEFGAVYFVVSVLFLVYINTRTRARGDGEVSAYSVFNPNFERIDGTLTAEQFEKEIRHGLGST